MNRRQRYMGIIKQVAILFTIAVVSIGVVTYFSQRSLSDVNVSKQTERMFDSISEEVKGSVREYPAYEWLLDYWYENSDILDIEYDAEYNSGTETHVKYQLLKEHHPELTIKYATTEEVRSFSAEDQKLFAEIVYSWLITRINQIKASFDIDYLFCVVSGEPYNEQFFLFSGADPGAVRGTNYEEAYPLGTEVTVAESQQNAMSEALENTTHLADAGNYVDYYSYMCSIGDKAVFIGLTYDLSDLNLEIKQQTVEGTGYAIIHQICLSAAFMLLLYYFVLKPLKKVLQNINLYKTTKDSAAVAANLAQVRPHNEIGQLSEDITDLTREIDEYTTEIGKISAEKERIETELSLATRIQASMLPNIFPPFPDRKEFDIFADMEPAREVGGDFYDFFLVDDDHLCLVIADVSGKGVPAALFMMASRIILANNAKMGKPPAVILQDTNNSICANNREEMFVTVWLGILEISTGKLTAANAGHEYPAIRRANGRFELFKDPHGFVVGGMEGMAYKEYEIQLEPGDSLFVYTDGVPEAANNDKVLFGNDRMLDALNAHEEYDPANIINNVGVAVAEFVNNAPQFDDVTMLCLTYKGPAEDSVSYEEITVDADVSNIDRVTEFADKYMEAMGCPFKVCMQIDVAVDEIFSNIAHYAYPDGGSATVRIGRKQDPEGVVMTFIDQGIPYDPTVMDEPDVTLPLEQRSIGGLGIHIVRNTMDDVEYEYKDGCNILTITKNI